MRVVTAEGDALLGERLVPLPASPGHEMAGVARSNPKTLPALRFSSPYRAVVRTARLAGRYRRGSSSTQGAVHPYELCPPAVA